MIPIALFVACASPTWEGEHPVAREHEDATQETIEEVSETTLTLTPEGESTPDPDSARIVEFWFPAELACGETDEGYVMVENTGTTTWSRAEDVKLGAVGDEDPLFDSGDVRVWLEDDVSIQPGEVFAFPVALVGPDMNGAAVTDWQMVREGVHWFGEIATTEVVIVCAEGGDEALPLPRMDRPDGSDSGRGNHRDLDGARALLSVHRSNTSHP